MKAFELTDIKITSKADQHGDTVITGTARVIIDGAASSLSAGTRVTAEQKRGGATVEAAEDKVAGNLAKLAARKART